MTTVITLSQPLPGVCMRVVARYICVALTVALLMLYILYLKLNLILQGLALKSTQSHNCTFGKTFCVIIFLENQLSTYELVTWSTRFQKYELEGKVPKVRSPILQTHMTSGTDTCLLSNFLCVHCTNSSLMFLFHDLFRAGLVPFNGVVLHWPLFLVHARLCSVALLVSLQTNWKHTECAAAWADWMPYVNSSNGHVFMLLWLFILNSFQKWRVETVEAGHLIRNPISWLSNRLIKLPIQIGRVSPADWLYN